MSDSNKENHHRSEAASALVIAACDKAGMEGIDRTKIDAIILRESGNSAYMKQQRKRDEKVNIRIDKMLHELKLKDEKGEWRRVVERELETEIESHVRSRPTRSSCVVVDMDMYYMACELLTRPELNEKPCCVGGGLVTTSNYVARRYGVRSAMAGFIADKLVTELSGGKEKLVHIPSNFTLYTEKARQVRQVLSEYDPNMRAYSLDEAYLDIGNYLQLRMKGNEHEQIVKILRAKHGTTEDVEQGVEDDSAEQSHAEDPLASYPPHVALRAAGEIVNEVRQRVFEATGGLTCSAGLAPSFMLAKIASDRKKPNGQLLVGPSHEEVLEFLHPLPTRKVGGIGRVTEKMLHALNVSSVKDLYNQRATVRFCFKPATAKFLLKASLGCSSHESQDDDDDEIGRKGISRERTFASGRPWSEICDKLEAIVRQLSSDMREKNLWAHTITLKVKLHTFDVMSRARSLARGVYTQDADEMLKFATELLRETRQQSKGTVFSVRLLGIRCSNFQGEQERINANQMNIRQYFSAESRALHGEPKSPECEQERHEASEREHPSQAANDISMTGFLTEIVEKDSTEERKGRRVISSCGQSFAPPSKHQDNVPEPFVGSSDPEESGDPVSCPICGKIFRPSDNAGLNSHIDVCLSGPTVAAAAKEESLLAKPKKRQRLTDFFEGA